ncbi:MAG: hypothetical protein ACLP4V_12100 [Methylocella sp.]
MTGHVPDIRETLFEMAEQILLTANVVPDDPGREHWREYILRELRAAYARGELNLGHHRPANAPPCVTLQ